MDAWSNLSAISPTADTAYTGCTQQSGFSKTPDSANHLSGFSYDASGNTFGDGVYTYTWDGESQLKSAGGLNYLYDGEGRRVSKSNGKLYWYGSGGEILTETNASGGTTNEYIFFNGKRIALLPAASAAQFYAEDFLGSSRIVTTNTGVVCYDADFSPYGGERTLTMTCPQNAYKFEGKERDAETLNDDFGARYYSNRFGRWLSADWSNVPVAVPYANLSNPQTLNLYSMVADDPESFADLDGHKQGGPYPPGEYGGGLGLIESGDWRRRPSIDMAPSGMFSGNHGDVPYWLAYCTLEDCPAQDSGTPQEQNQTQNQQNQQTQNTQQPAAPAQSGINPNYKLPTLDTVLKKASDFSAGAGDCLTGRCLFLGTSLTEKARQLNGADSVVDKGSGAYLGGKVTGAVVGTGIASLAVANAAVGLESKVAIHAAHHAFEYLGGARLAHIQVILWIAGQKGSDLSLRIPLPWK